MRRASPTSRGGSPWCCESRPWRAWRSRRGCLQSGPERADAAPRGARHSQARRSPMSWCWVGAAAQTTRSRTARTPRARPERGARSVPSPPPSANRGRELSAASGVGRRDRRWQRSARGEARRSSRGGVSRPDSGSAGRTAVQQAERWPRVGAERLRDPANRATPCESRCRWGSSPAPRPACP